MHALLRRTGRLSLALWLLAAAGSVHAQQDTWSGVERIVAVGDVHGDCAQLVAVLRAAEVIDENSQWIAGKTHLVQTGDVLDRAADSRRAMDLLMKLQKQAAAAGGAVHALVGNHEAMVLLDDWRYVHPGEIEALGGDEAFRRAMSAEGVYGKWIRAHHAAVKINDFLFVHAGIEPSFARMSLTELNKAIRAELSKNDAQGIAMDPDGPLWTRALVAADAEGPSGEFLDAVLKAYGVKHMVVGHTVSTEGILVEASGRLIRIDVGMSGYYGGPAACLVVDKGAWYEVRRNENGQPEKRRLRQEAAMPVR